MNTDRPNTIVYKEILNIADRTFLIVRLANPSVKTGTVCKDNLGHTYTVSSCPHYHFTTPNIPEWYWKTPEFVLDGNCLEIGDYLIIED